MAQADVCLILEGTYPYVAGGVSTWVHNLISSLKQVKFSLVVILPKRDSYSVKKYDVPDNVLTINEIYLHEYSLGKTKKFGSNKVAYEVLRRFYQNLKQKDYSTLLELFEHVLDPATRKVSPHYLFNSVKSWDLLLEIYNIEENENSFVDFFWTWRYSHLPLLKLIDAPLPEAKIYHTISTGYASVLSLIAHFKMGVPIFLTEHGIYTNERRIEIEQSDWIYEKRGDEVVISNDVSPFKDFWIAFFEHIGRMTYLYAEKIITLHENNRKFQLLHGAPMEKTMIIPNGINLVKFKETRDTENPNPRKRVGFIGRVVPIKDVKTFIRACKIIFEELPNTEFLIMGPAEEEPDYYNECLDLVEILELQEIINFTGPVNVIEAYPTLDIVVLTSISEAQPLVIMEANCCGVPCVSTDVGGCAELLNGRTPDDIALGPSGYVTPIFNPTATAEAVLRILTNPELQNAMGESGIERIRTYYDEKDLNFSYLDLYRQTIREIDSKRKER